MNRTLVKDSGATARGTGASPSLKSVSPTAAEFISPMKFHYSRRANCVVHVDSKNIARDVTTEDFQAFVLRAFEAKHEAPLSLAELELAIRHRIATPNALPSIDRGPTRRRGSDSKSPSMSEALLRVAQERCGERFHSGDAGYVCVRNAAGGTDTLRIDSRAFGQWLLNEWRVAHHGKVPSKGAVTDVLAMLESEALAGESKDVHRRVARHDGAYYIDLANEDRQVVRVTRHGWRILSDSPVHFVRDYNTLPLPVPVPGGSLDELRALTNVSSESDFVLLVTWVLAALTAQPAYPILSIDGEQDAAKSTLTELVQRLTDPSRARLRSLPRDERDLAVAALRAHVLAFDNVSKLADWLSDALCKIATGGSFSTRKLHTDDEEKLFELCRALVLNGIVPVATRPDLASRCFLIRLEGIRKENRREKAAFWRDFDEAHPRIFGALLDGLVGALARLDDTSIQTEHRMTDVIRLATAAEHRLGFPDGAVCQAVDSMMNSAIALQLESQPVAVEVLALLKSRGRTWSGSTSQLDDALRASRKQRQDARGAPEGALWVDWPKGAAQLSRALADSKPLLRRVGVDIEQRRTKHGSEVTLFLSNQEERN